MEEPLQRWINDLGMILLSLVLAMVVWIVAVQEENPIEEGEFSEPIPIEVRNQPPGTTFLPAAFEESVRLTIRAPRSNWVDLRPSKFTAWIDLEGQGPGDYEVPVQSTCTDRNVRILELKPASVPVRLKEEISRTVPVQVQLYGSAALGYTINTDQAIIEPNQVTVTGPAPIVEQVTKATLDLYLRDVKETYTGRRNVVARQANDEAVGNFVTIQPPTVQITIPVVQKTGFNEVAVRAVLTGSVASGYWVRGVTVDPITVLLVGDPAVVSQVSGFVETAPLNISGASANVVERMPLNLPEGASIVGEQGVLVTVNVAAQQGSLTVSRKPLIRGLSTDLAAKVTPEEVQLTLIGPLARLNDLADEDVYVYVELVDKGIGQYRIGLTYLVPEGLQVESIVPESVDVEISRTFVTRTPTPLPTPTSSAPLTASQQISGTLGITAGITIAPVLSSTLSTTATITGALPLSNTAGISTTIAPTGTVPTGGAQDPFEATIEPTPTPMPSPEDCL
jgi:YbbR domain-containing protein